jgi:hypothetical protein
MPSVPNDLILPPIWPFEGGKGGEESPIIPAVTILNQLPGYLHCELGAEKSKGFFRKSLLVSHRYYLKVLIKTYYVMLRPSSTPNVQWAIYRAAFTIFREEDPFHS